MLTFRIKKGAPTSYRIRQKGVMAVKPETGDLKYIGYYRGHDTIFTEDIKNKDIKPARVPDFVLNPTSNKCELRVDERDTALVKLIQNHPDNGKKWEIYSEEIEFEKKLGKSEAIEKALEYIKESDDMRIRALGLAIFGISNYGKSMLSTKALLKEKAINKPEEVITACEDELFDNKFVASMALCSGIIKTNSTMTAIVWADNNGRILNIATGEDFVTKLAKYISNNNPESKSLLQEMGARLELTKKKDRAKSDAERRVEELEAEIARMKGEKVSEINVVEPEVIDLKKLALQEVQERYEAVLGKKAPVRYKYNIEWMQERIKEQENVE